MAHYTRSFRDAVADDSDPMKNQHNYKLASPELVSNVNRFPPSKGCGHCSLCGERRVNPTRAGVAWRECKDCGDPLAVGSCSKEIATLIARNLF